ncbi:sushi, von Willebrand factor type A, EGF and pentraxin domain-containing protein 1-like [Lethenteron reissneri]|uniref:sushi, von Willebrand factor type A, EGF and pentraxin domain-containing protein 1-like n=1 Tax=Lethenteron reissneri TaxID=7753 RepID=UPI002AB75B04|nr:sushi, von Willebrand factor type A, EGF and pentraxin domain-containing protein 1-like [Lethenteron reissneri]
MELLNGVRRGTLITQYEMGTGTGRTIFGSGMLPARLMQCLCVLIFIPRLGADPMGCIAPQIENANFDGSSGSVAIGSKVTYACKPGFLLVGQNTLTCISNAEWSDSEPECQAFCEKPLPHGNAQVSPQYSRRELYYINQYAHFTCNKDFVSPSNGFYMTCMRSENGSAHWVQESNLTCTATLCTMFEELMHGSFEGSNKIGDSVRFKCDERFLLVGSYELTCLKSGKWTGDAPTCQPFCAGQPKPQNAMISTNHQHKEKYAIGSSITFQCLPRYRAINAGYDFNVSCREDISRGVQWLPENTCIYAECEQNVSIKNGHVISGLVKGLHFTIGYSLIIKCNYNSKTKLNQTAFIKKCCQDSNGFVFWKNVNEDEC